MRESRLRLELLGLKLRPDPFSLSLHPVRSHNHRHRLPLLHRDRRPSAQFNIKQISWSIFSTTWLTDQRIAKLVSRLQLTFLLFPSAFLAINFYFDWHFFYLLVFRLDNHFELGYSLCQYFFRAFKNSGSRSARPLARVSESAWQGWPLDAKVMSKKPGAIQNELRERYFINWCIFSHNRSISYCNVWNLDCGVHL